MVTLEGIFLWTNHPYHEAQGLVRKGWAIGQSLERWKHQYPIVNPIQSNQWKEKWQVWFLSNEIESFLVSVRKSKRREDSPKCQRKILATCARRHLQAEVVFIITSSSTLARAQAFHATNALIPPILLVIWGNTFWYTLEKNHIIATNVLIQPIMLVIWRNTFWFTLETNVTIAIYVITQQLNQAIWRGTN